MRYASFYSLDELGKEEIERYTHGLVCPLFPLVRDRIVMRCIFVCCSPARPCYLHRTGLTIASSLLHPKLRLACTYTALTF